MTTYNIDTLTHLHNMTNNNKATILTSMATKHFTDQH